MYAKYIKRPLDMLLSLAAVVVLMPLLALLSVIGAIVMRGNPFFVQLRPGRIDPKTGREVLFRLVKFRSMDNRRDKHGNLLPDELRLNRYGRFLRASSLDELPELFNILKGDMSIVGPRPQLVQDMVFMTAEQRRRHTVRQGLTGLAQVNGRNDISWEEKLAYDLRYVDHITFWGDVQIVWRTFGRVLMQDGINEDDLSTATDFGDYLLKKGCLDEQEYRVKHEEAQLLLTEKSS